MATEFQNVGFQIPEGRGTRTFNRTVRFNGDINSIGTAIQGYQLDFTSKDHHINIVEINSFVTGTNSDFANIRVTCQYADKNFDDPYKGFVSVVAMADVG